MTTNLHAYGVGKTRPTNEEAPAGGAAQGFGNHANEHDDFAIVDAERKALAKANAEAALAGCTLHRLEGGAYLVTRWSLAREFPDLQGAVALVHQIAGVVA